MRILREDPNAFVEAQLESLRPVPPGQPEKAGQVRVAFLVQVRELRQQAAAAQSADLFPVFTPPVSVHQKGRLNEWITFFQHLFGKEPR